MHKSDWSRIGSTHSLNLLAMFWIVAILLSSSAALSVEFEDQGPENKNITTDNKIENLQNEIKFLQSNINDLKTQNRDIIQTIKSVSEQSILAGDSTITKITLMLGIPSAAVALIAIFLALIGFREIRDIHRIKNDFANNLNEVDNTTKNLNAWGSIHTIKHLIQSYKTYDQGLKVIKEILESNPTDNIVMSSTYAWKGYILKRKKRYFEALAATEKAIQFDPDNPILKFNAACYSALTNDLSKTKSYLEETIQLGGEDWKRITKDEIDKEDGDFRDIRNLPEFKKILEGLSIIA